MQVTKKVSQVKIGCLVRAVHILYEQHGLRARSPIMIFYFDFDIFIFY